MSEVIFVEKEKLIVLLEKAFDSGWYGYMDAKECVIEELVEELLEYTRNKNRLNSNNMIQQVFDFDEDNVPLVGGNPNPTVPPMNMPISTSTLMYVSSPIPAQSEIVFEPEPEPEPEPVSVSTSISGTPEWIVGWQTPSTAFI